MGLHNSILVRPHGDRFQLVDGAYRLAAHEHLGLKEIEVISREMTDSEVLACQIQANSMRKETIPIEYAKHLLRLQATCPDITMAQLAQYAGKNSYWVRQQLDMLNLRLEYQIMVDRGQLPLMNAYRLGKLPPHIQGRYIQQALSMGRVEFETLVAEEINRLRVNKKDRAEAHREAARHAEPHPYLRPLKTLKDELRAPTAAKGLVADVKPATHVDAFLLGVKWALNVDPHSITDRKEKLADANISRVISKNSERNGPSGLVT